MIINNDTNYVWSPPIIELSKNIIAEFQKTRISNQSRTLGTEYQITVPYYNKKKTITKIPSCVYIRIDRSPSLHIYVYTLDSGATFNIYIKGVQYTKVINAWTNFSFFNYNSMETTVPLYTQELRKTNVKNSGYVLSGSHYVEAKYHANNGGDYFITAGNVNNLMNFRVGKFYYDLNNLYFTLVITAKTGSSTDWYDHIECNGGYIFE